MDILSEEWFEVAEKYCNHYDFNEQHYGEIKNLKKDAPDYAKKFYTKQLQIWKKKGYTLSKDADDYL